ncbi:hypothetical protein BH20ACI2_BH20ACI2_01320 [soil metagenome]
MITMDQNKSTAACYLRSECRAEADREYFDRLFAHNWEYFVIKRDERSNLMTTFVECCGTEVKLG